MKALERDPHEAYAVARAMRREVHMHVGPTNSGKTHAALDALQRREAAAALARAAPGAADALASAVTAEPVDGGRAAL